MVRRERLSPEEVVDAAIALIESEGVDGLTMRHLATELGVDPASLYRAVGSKEQVLDAVADRVLAEPNPVSGASVDAQSSPLAPLCRLMPFLPLVRQLVDACTPPAPWRSRLLESAHGLRARLVARPQLAPVAIRRVDAASFEATGAPPEATRSTYLFTLGFVLLEVRNAVAGGRDREFTTALEALVRGLGI